MFDFNVDSRVVVTGASSGLGLSVALLLNSLGVDVIAIARSASKLESARLIANNPDNFHLYPFDLNQVEEIPGAIKSIVSNFGKLSGLVHSAGIGGVMPLKSLDISLAKDMFQINYFSALMLAKAVSDKRNYSFPPSMVFLSSISAISGNAGISNYSASKGAIISMVKSLAVELSRQNIRVNAVSPGFIVTEIVKSSPDVYNDDFFKKIKDEYPLGEGRPSDVACAIAFLISNCSRWITGQNIVIDGGRTLL